MPRMPWHDQTVGPHTVGSSAPAAAVETTPRTCDGPPSPWGEWSPSFRRAPPPPMQQDPNRTFLLQLHRNLRKTCLRHRCFLGQVTAPPPPPAQPPLFWWSTTPQARSSTDDPAAAGPPSTPRGRLTSIHTDMRLHVFWNVVTTQGCSTHTVIPEQGLGKERA